jgi:hypothetical protein
MQLTISWVKWTIPILAHGQGPTNGPGRNPDTRRYRDYSPDHVPLACASKGQKYQGEPRSMEILILEVKTKLHGEFQLTSLPEKPVYFKNKIVFPYIATIVLDGVLERTVR